MKTQTRDLVRLITFAVVVIGLSGFGIFAIQDPVVTVNPTETHQTMKGWEVTARLWEVNKREDRFDPSWELYKDEIFSRLVNELGINRVRIGIRSGMENPVDHWSLFRDQNIGYKEFKRHYYEKINDNDDPHVANPSGFHFAQLDYEVEKIVLPLAKLVEANGEKLFVNLTYHDFRPIAEKGNLSHALNPEEYAEFVHAAFHHLNRRFGFTPDALGIILEPENTEHWGGRQIGAAMVAAARRLKQAGFSPEIIAPSTTAATAAPQYFDEITKVPGAARLMSELSYHRYDSPSSNEALPAILRRAKKFGLRTGMLEHLGGDAAELHADLTLANASAWQQYGIAAELPSGERDRGTAYYIAERSNTGERALRMAERTPDLAQYFRFIRGGAVRIGAVSSSRYHLVVAFRNPNGAHVVVVQAKRAGTIKVVGLPAGSYGFRYTTAAETARELPATSIDSGQALIARLPALGIITFYEVKSI